MEFNERVLLKAISSLLKEKGFPNPKIDREKGRVETEYYTQGDFRTRVEATVKKISRKDSEVSLAVITERRSGSKWKEKKMMEKEQYEKFFDEIEMQAYRELANPE